MMGFADDSILTSSFKQVMEVTAEVLAVQLYP